MRKPREARNAGGASGKRRRRVRCFQVLKLPRFDGHLRKREDVRMSRRYSKEFKASAVQLCEDRGWRMADVARELGVDYDTLYRWVTEARGRVPARDHGNETKDQELA